MMIDYDMMMMWFIGCHNVVGVTTIEPDYICTGMIKWAQLVEVLLTAGIELLIT